MFGHEIHHGANFVLTRNTSELPDYMKSDNPGVQEVFASIKESVAQHFENRVLRLFVENPDLYNQFKFFDSHDTFSRKISQIHKVSDYQRTYSNFVRMVLAQSTQSKITEQLEALTPHELAPGAARKAIHNHRGNWDKATDMFMSGEIRELKYAVDDVTQIVDNHSVKTEPDRKRIEQLVLTGQYTRRGLRYWIELNKPEQQETDSVTPSSIQIPD